MKQDNKNNKVWINGFLQKTINQQEATVNKGDHKNTEDFSSCMNKEKKCKCTDRLGW